MTLHMSQLPLPFPAPFASRIRAGGVFFCFMDSVTCVSNRQERKREAECSTSFTTGRLHGPRPDRGTSEIRQYYLVMEGTARSGAAMTEHRPRPACAKWLEAVHCPDYVDQVFRAAFRAGQGTAHRLSGNPGDHLRVRHTKWRTWLAAKLAMQHGYAANSALQAATTRCMIPGAGYCVFNDLAVAANR